MPIGFRGLADARVDGAGRRVAAHLAAGVEQRLTSGAQQPPGIRLIDKQGLGRAANARPPHLRIEHDCARHIEIGGLVHIDVADAFEMREHRHARLLLHALDEALAAARHDHIDGAAKPSSMRPTASRSVVATS